MQSLCLGQKTEKWKEKRRKNVHENENVNMNTSIDQTKKRKEMLASFSGKMLVHQPNDKERGRKEEGKSRAFAPC